MKINRESENFKKVFELFEKELGEEADYFIEIALEKSGIFVYPAFNERFSENIILQFHAVKLLDNIDCACCMNDKCDSTVEEKIEHILNDFFEEPELFLSAEFLQTHPDFFE